MIDRARRPARSSAATRTPPAMDDLAGRYFLALDSGPDGRASLKAHGRIEGYLGHGHYIVEIYEWALGRPVRRELASIGQISEQGWWLYETLAEQQNEVRHRLQRQQRRGTA